MTSDSGGTLSFDQLTNCNTIDTDGSGVFACGTDETINNCSTAGSCGNIAYDTELIGNCSTQDSCSNILYNQSKSKYLFFSGIDFIAINPDVNDVSYNSNGVVGAATDAISLFAPVHLPDGAVITGFQAFGSAAGEFLLLQRNNASTYEEGSLEMVRAYVGAVGNKTISYSTINNLLHVYFLQTSTIDTGDEISGALINYTMVDPWS